MSRRTLLAASVVPFVLAPVALAASPPKAGQRLRGTTSQDQPVTGRVTSDGRSLQMTFAETFTCTDGKRFKLRARYVDQRPKIRRDGVVEYEKVYLDRPGLPEFPGTHNERQRITGEFTDGGRRFGARSLGTLSRGSRTCKSEIRLSLRAVG